MEEYEGVDFVDIEFGADGENDIPRTGVNGDLDVVWKDYRVFGDFCAGFGVRFTEWILEVFEYIKAKFKESRELFFRLSDIIN